MHCHIELHNVQGMAMAFEYGKPREQWGIQDNLPTCNNYDGILGFATTTPTPCELIQLFQQKMIAINPHLYNLSGNCGSHDGKSPLNCPQITNLFFT